MTPDDYLEAPQTCPECGRRRVRNWVYDHRRAHPACSIGNREDATQAADHDRFRQGWNWTPAFRGPTEPAQSGVPLVPGFLRPSTAAELALVGIAEPTGYEETHVRQRVDGIHHRVIAGVDAP